MKSLFLALVLSTAGQVALNAQTSTDQFDREAQFYQALAVKLYPDCAVADSPLVKLMYKVDAVMKANNSKLYNLSSKPLIEAAAAASILKITPRWNAVTEGEKNTAFDMLAVAVITTHDLSPSEAPLASSPPAEQPFNPGSMQADATASPPTTPPAPTPPLDPKVVPSRKGFIYFYNDLVNRSGGMTGHGKGMSEPEYKSGPLEGKTEGEGRAYAQEQWSQMSRDQQIACEQNAAIYGMGPDPDAPKTSRTYYYQPNGMGGGTITGP